MTEDIVIRLRTIRQTPTTLEAADKIEAQAAEITRLRALAEGMGAACAGGEVVAGAVDPFDASRVSDDVRELAFMLCRRDGLEPQGLTSINGGPFGRAWLNYARQALDVLEPTPPRPLLNSGHEEQAEQSQASEGEVKA